MDADIDRLIGEEAELAKELKQLCEPSGRENNDSLLESARIFHRMGRVYITKSQITNGMDQKLNFIKAATLLHGALARCQVVEGDARLKEDIRGSLNEMQTILMIECSGTLATPLIETSRRVLKEFECYRSEERNRLESLEDIEENMPENEAFVKKGEKIEAVEKILLTNSDNYKKQMRTIAQECVNILGLHPCNFAVIGFGSLARNEVTLRSNFEHVIIAEDGVKDRQDYEKIMEYFRWFSTIFHIIIIGIGETAISRVGIESLNDLYSTKKSKNWFCDSVTPSGISFDGLIPHASKIPLEKQRRIKSGELRKPRLSILKEFMRKEYGGLLSGVENIISDAFRYASATQDRIIELMKPVSEMARFLTKEEGMIDGYYLKDVSSEICFVFGSVELFENFEGQVGQILQQEQTALDILEASDRDVGLHVFLNEDGDRRANPKNILYHPLTLIIHYISILRRGCGKSGFEKIRSLRLFSEIDQKDFLWAFAVACEVRLKACVCDYDYRTEISCRELSKFVGKTCAFNSIETYFAYSQILRDLSKSIRCKDSLALEFIITIVMYWMQGNIKPQNDGSTWVLVSSILGETGENSKVSRSLFTRDLDIVNQQNSICHARMHILAASAGEFLRLEKAEKVLTYDFLSKNPMMLFCLSHIKRMQGDYKMQKKYADEIFDKFDSNSLNVHLILESRTYQMLANLECLSAGEFDEYCTKLLDSSRTDGSSKLAACYGRALKQHQIGQKSLAARLWKEMRKIAFSQLDLKNSKSATEVAGWINQVASVQFSDEKWYLGCVESIQSFEEIVQSLETEIDLSILGTFCRSPAAVSAYVEASKDAEEMEDKFAFFKRAIEICKRLGAVDPYQLMYRFAIVELTKLCISSNCKECGDLNLFSISNTVRRDLSMKRLLDATEEYCSGKSQRQRDDMFAIIKTWHDEHEKNIAACIDENLFKQRTEGFRPTASSTQPQPSEESCEDDSPPKSPPIQSPIQQRLTIEENDLVRQLKEHCNARGKEKSCSESSVDIFCKMGVLYTIKADFSDGMNQKLNFIKSATLLHGARVRSEMFLGNRLGIPIQHALDEMQNILMKKCSAVAETSLMTISRRVMTAFESYRAEEKKVLDSIEMIPEGIPENEARRRRDRKIELIEKLMIENSENYKKQMTEIALDCLKILRNPPCDFAVIGLGSLARNEVTLCSDFEHVIVLEEEVKDREDYGNILEYFRWFSVVFHIIIIGMGETMIPSIGIESLNDFYSNNNSKEDSKNWFHDSLTPSGVSFDGMMPHACKIPLGRQIGTKNKQHIVELIKPVNEMARYLTRKEDMINGYYLKDVLSETCFVFGSEKLFQEFERQAGKIMEKEQNGADVLEWLENNPNPIVRTNKNFPNALVNRNQKKMLYRPTSVVIHYLSIWKNGSGKSGFDKLRSMTFSSEIERENFLWAFAVACEVRLKVCAEKDGNRMNITGRDVVRYVGKSCAFNCVLTYDNYLGYLRRFCLGVNRNTPHFNETIRIAEQISPLFYRDDPSQRMKAWQFLGDDDELYKECERLSNHPLGKTISGKQMVADIRARKHMIALSTDGNLDSLNFQQLKLAENALEDDSLQRSPRILYSLCVVKWMQGNYKMVKKYADEIFDSFDARDLNVHLSLQGRWYQMLGNLHCLPGKEFDDYCVNLLDSDDVDGASKLSACFGRAVKQHQIGEKKEAARRWKDMRKIAFSKVDLRNPETASFVLYWINQVSLYQYNYEKWFLGCVESIETFEEIAQSVDISMDISILGQFCHSLYAVLAYTDASKETDVMEEKFAFCTKAIEICKRLREKDPKQIMHRFAIVKLTELCISEDCKEYGDLNLFSIYHHASSCILEDHTLEYLYNTCEDYFRDKSPERRDIIIKKMSDWCRNKQYEIGFLIVKNSHEQRVLSFDSTSQQPSPPPISTLPMLDEISTFLQQQGDLELQQLFELLQKS